MFSFSFGLQCINSINSAKLALSEGEEITAARRTSTSEHQQDCKQLSDNTLNLFSFNTHNYQILLPIITKQEAEHVWFYPGNETKCFHHLPVVHPVAKVFATIQYFFSKITKKVMPTEKLELLFYDIKKQL